MIISDFWRRQLSTSKINDGVHVTSRGPYVVTFSGKKFFPLDVRSSDICIEDIAHALSLQCRFGGHVKRHYSVGQHSIHVADEMRKVIPGCMKSVQLRGLLHDASEAFLIDLPRPLKQIQDFSVYRNIEAATQGVIYHKYGLPANLKLMVDEGIKVADNLLLAKEAKDLLDNPYWCHAMPKSKQRIPIMTPKEVEKKFLKKFEELYL